MILPVAFQFYRAKNPIEYRCKDRPKKKIGRAPLGATAKKKALYKF